jgi:hypothetical protein
MIFQGGRAVGLPPLAYTESPEDHLKLTEEIVMRKELRYEQIDKSAWSDGSWERKVSEILWKWNIQHKA